MSRLIAVGCSHKVGEGLPDKPEIPPPSTSMYAWPVHLGKKLNLPVKNIAQGGISNKQICKLILDEQLFQSDIVVFMWTYFARTCFFENEKTSKRVTVSETKRSLRDPKKFFRKIPTNQQTDSTYSKKFYKTYFSHYNAVWESYQNINFAKYYLDSMGIKNVHTTCEIVPYLGINDNGEEQKFPAPEWNIVNLEEINLYRKSNSNLHSDANAHEKMSVDILSYIDREYKL